MCHADVSHVLNNEINEPSGGGYSGYSYPKPEVPFELPTTTAAPQCPPGYIVDRNGSCKRVCPRDTILQANGECQPKYVDHRILFSFNSIQF